MISTVLFMLRFPALRAANSTPAARYRWALILPSFSWFAMIVFSSSTVFVERSIAIIVTLLREWQAARKTRPPALLFVPRRIPFLRRMGGPGPADPAANPLNPDPP